MSKDKYEQMVTDSDIKNFVDFQEAVYSGRLDTFTKKIMKSGLFDTRAAESFSFADKLIISTDNEFVWCRYLNGMKHIIDLKEDSVKYIDDMGNDISKSEFHQRLYCDIFMILPNRN